MTAEDINIGFGALLQTFEMTCFAFLHIKAFSYKPYVLLPDSPAVAYIPRYSRLRALGHAFDFRETLRELWDGCIYMGQQMRGKETDVRARRVAVMERALGRSRGLAGEKHPFVGQDEDWDPADDYPLPAPAGDNRLKVQVGVDRHRDVSGQRQWLGVSDHGARREKSDGLEAEIERELQTRGYTLRGKLDRRQYYLQPSHYTSPQVLQSSGSKSGTGAQPPPMGATRVAGGVVPSTASPTRLAQISEPSMPPTSPRHQYHGASAETRTSHGRGQGACANRVWSETWMDWSSTGIRLRHRSFGRSENATGDETMATTKSTELVTRAWMDMQDFRSLRKMMDYCPWTTTTGARGARLCHSLLLPRVLVNTNRHPEAGTRNRCILTSSNRCLSDTQPMFYSNPCQDVSSGRTPSSGVSFPTRKASIPQGQKPRRVPIRPSSLIGRTSRWQTLLAGRSKCGLRMRRQVVVVSFRSVVQIRTCRRLLLQQHRSNLHSPGALQLTRRSFSAHMPMWHQRRMTRTPRLCIPLYTTHSLGRPGMIPTFVDKARAI